jgi:hypothetical protein
VIYCRILVLLLNGVALLDNGVLMDEWHLAAHLLIIENIGTELILKDIWLRFADFVIPF